MSTLIPNPCLQSQGILYTGCFCGNDGEFILFYGSCYVPNLGTRSAKYIRDVVGENKQVLGLGSKTLIF